MGFITMPPARAGTQFYIGKGPAKRKFALDNVSGNNVIAREFTRYESAATSFKTWSIDEWQKLTGLTIHPDLLAKQAAAQATEKATEKAIVDALNSFNEPIAFTPKTATKPAKAPKAAKAPKTPVAPVDAPAPADTTPYVPADTTPYVPAEPIVVYEATDEMCTAATNSGCGDKPIGKMGKPFQYDGKYWQALGGMWQKAITCKRIYPKGTEPDLSTFPKKQQGEDYHVGYTYTYGGKTYVLGVETLRITQLTAEQLATSDAEWTARCARPATPTTKTPTSAQGTPAADSYAKPTAPPCIPQDDIITKAPDEQFYQILSNQLCAEKILYYNPDADKDKVVATNHTPFKHGGLDYVAVAQFADKWITCYRVHPLTKAPDFSQVNPEATGTKRHMGMHLRCGFHPGQQANWVVGSDVLYMLNPATIAKDGINGDVVMEILDAREKAEETTPDTAITFDGAGNQLQVGDKVMRPGGTLEYTVKRLAEKGDAEQIIHVSTIGASSFENVLRVPASGLIRKGTTPPPPTPTPPTTYVEVVREQCRDGSQIIFCKPAATFTKQVTAQEFMAGIPNAAEIGVTVKNVGGSDVISIDLTKPIPAPAIVERDAQFIGYNLTRQHLYTNGSQDLRFVLDLNNKRLYEPKGAGQRRPVKWKTWTEMNDSARLLSKTPDETEAIRNSHIPTIVDGMTDSEVQIALETFMQPANNWMLVTGDDENGNIAHRMVIEQEGIATLWYSDKKRLLIAMLLGRWAEQPFKQWVQEKQALAEPDHTTPAPRLNGEIATDPLDVPLPDYIKFDMPDWASGAEMIDTRNGNGVRIKKLDNGEWKVTDAEDATKTDTVQDLSLAKVWARNHLAKLADPQAEAARVSAMLKAGRERAAAAPPAYEWNAGTSDAKLKARQKALIKESNNLARRGEMAYDMILNDGGASMRKLEAASDAVTKELRAIEQEMIRRTTAEEKATAAKPAYIYALRTPTGRMLRPPDMFVGPCTKTQVHRHVQALDMWTLRQAIAEAKALRDDWNADRWTEQVNRAKIRRAPGIGVLTPGEREDLNDYLFSGEYPQWYANKPHEEVWSGKPSEPFGLPAKVQPTAAVQPATVVELQPAAAVVEPPPAIVEPEPEVVKIVDVAELRKEAFGYWGWEQEYSDFFMELVNKTDGKGNPIPILFAGLDNLPTIHSWKPEDGENRHAGFGCFIISKPGFKAVFDAGGAMNHHGKISYTTVNVEEGKMPDWYNADAVRAELVRRKELAAMFDRMAEEQQAIALAAEAPAPAMTKEPIVQGIPVGVGGKLTAEGKDLLAQTGSKPAAKPYTPDGFTPQNPTITPRPEIRH